MESVFVSLFRNVCLFGLFSDQWSSDELLGFGFVFSGGTLLWMSVF